VTEQAPIPPGPPTAPPSPPLPPPPQAKKKKWPYILLGLVLGFVLLLILIFVVVGVGVHKVVETAEEEGLINTKTREGKIGETLPCGKDLTLLIHGASKSSGEKYFKPKEGNYFLVVDMEFTNTGNETEAISSLMELSIKDNSGREYDPAFAPELMTLPEGNILPGEKVRGLVPFEIPQTQTTGLSVKFSPVLGDAVIVKLPQL